MTKWKAGSRWLSHTTNCPHWQKANAHLFEPSTNELPSRADGGIDDLNTSTQQLHMDSNRGSETVNQDTIEANSSAAIVASLGLRLTVRVPVRLRRPAAVVDVLPAGPESIVPEARTDSISGEAENTARSGVGQPSIRLALWHSTAPNIFGLFRSYPRFIRTTRPLIPDLGIASAAVDQPSPGARQQYQLERTVIQIISPFPNISLFRFACWYYLGGIQKSNDSRKALVDDVILAEDFSQDHFRGHGLRSLDDALSRLDNLPVGDESDELSAAIGASDGWQKRSITISVPVARTGRRNPPSSGTDESPESYGRQVAIPGFCSRDLVEVIHANFSRPLAAGSLPYHYVPYQEWYRPSPGAPEQRVYGELYTGNVWIEEHAALQRSPPVPGCQLERVIAACMLWSDATQLAQFSQSSIWPVYLFFGNQSKIDRRRPLTRSCEHLAYLPKLTGDVKSMIQAELGGQVFNDHLQKHVRREIFQACTRDMLNDKFLDAYKNGIKIVCNDGVERRVYPRIMTYSADYPEKTMVGCIRTNGAMPSLQSLVLKSDIHKLGTRQDRKTRELNLRIQDSTYLDNVGESRRLMYKEGYVVNSVHVERLLKPDCSVPTISAFLTRLRPLSPNFNPLRMLVPDVLHEFELGVWKSTLIHIIRLLDSKGQIAVTTFDSCFRKISTYPPDTIRKFSFDVSGMVKFAARDYEDVLQCCIPCLEGLFTDREFNYISRLIFTFATWHALAKLRMHTEATVNALDSQTTLLGARLRQFKAFSAEAFPSVVETNKEFEARKRRETQAALKNNRLPGPFQKQAREFSLSTPKINMLGDHPKAIRQFGSSDSYSTQIGELEHRRPKGQAKRTNHVDVVQGIATLNRRETHLRQKSLELQKLTETPNLMVNHTPPLATNHSGLDQEQEDSSPSDIHHHMAIRGSTVRFIDFFDEHDGDPAVRDFMPMLQDHILARLTTTNPAVNAVEFNESERMSISFPTGSMFQHATLRVHYTTYDIRRMCDVVGLRFKHYFVMVLSGDTNPDHPYWYARVLGIYHTNINRLDGTTEGRSPRRVEFLFVRWMEMVELGSWDRGQLDRVAYIRQNSYRDEFGFLDPASVIRTVHMIPAFAFGRLETRPGHKLSLDDPEKGDWGSYYVNRFVDRDMFMRYFGGGVGHFSHAPAHSETGEHSESEQEEHDQEEEINRSDEEGAGDFEGAPDEEVDEDEDEGIDGREEVEIEDDYEEDGESNYDGALEEDNDI
ncbi:hypothetical protein FRC12_006324 [Ceratobasidium sp. 428]|nr:hypothetical protein FRC12_006324 [Ceratobasidium sp. 428]